MLQDILVDSANPVLPQAVNQAAAGALARAGTILATAETLLSAAHEEPSMAIQLRAESLLREIDAGFAGYELPVELLTIRQQLSDIVEPAHVQENNDS